jgi:hypothetical protein
MTAVEWVEFGRRAFGVVEDGSVVAVLYWKPAGIGMLHPGGELVVEDACWSLAETTSPYDHEVLFKGGEDDTAAVLSVASDRWRAREEVELGLQTKRPGSACDAPGPTPGGQS